MSTNSSTVAGFLGVQYEIVGGFYPPGTITRGRVGTTEVAVLWVVTGGGCGWLQVVVAGGFVKLVSFECFDWCLCWSTVFR